MADRNGQDVNMLTLKHVSPDSEDTPNDYQVISERLRTQIEGVSNG